MSKVALLSIDFQKGFDDPIWGDRHNLCAEENMALLPSEWCKESLPAIHIQLCCIEKNSSLRSGFSGSEFKKEDKPFPTEMVFSKSVNSAFIGTKLEK